MGFFSFILLAVLTWLVWNICRNTTDALDKQTALQYEIVAIEKRIDDLTELLREGRDGQGEAAAAPRPAPSSSGFTSPQRTGPANSHDHVVDLNQASIDELMTLPKIGKSTAQKIIDHRPYASVGDLTAVAGITSDLLDELGGQLKV